MRGRPACWRAHLKGAWDRPQTARNCCLCSRGRDSGWNRVCGRSNEARLGGPRERVNGWFAPTRVVGTCRNLLSGRCAKGGFGGLYAAELLGVRLSEVLRFGAGSRANDDGPPRREGFRDSRISS